MEVTIENVMHCKGNELRNNIIMVKKVKELLETVDGVSTTADVWTAHHRSYLGMTVHWIDRDTLK